MVTESSTSTAVDREDARTWTHSSRFSVTCTTRSTVAIGGGVYLRTVDASRRRAMDAVGVTEQEIDKTEAESRRRDYERLKVQRETGDLHAGIDGMFTHAGQAAAAETDLEPK